MSTANEKLQQLLIKVEALRNQMDAAALFDSSLYFAVLDLIKKATLTEQELFETLTEYAGGFIARVDFFVSDSKPIRRKLNSKLQIVFQP